jgi:hypothetical protein
MAEAIGQPIWNLNIEVNDSPNQDEYENLMNEHRELITTLAKILVGYASERDRRALLFFALMINKAIETACDTLEAADEKAKNE